MKASTLHMLCILFHMFHCFIVSLLRFVSSFLRSFFGWSSEAAGHRGKGCRGNCFRTCCRASFRLTNGLALRVPWRVASSSWSAKAPAFVKKNGQFLSSCLSFFRTCRTWQSEMGTLFPTLLYHFRPAFTHIQGYFSLMRRFIFCVKS